MKKQICPLTTEQVNLQEVFWTWIDKSVRQLVADLAHKALELIRDNHLNAGWNKRSAGRPGYRNGYYLRQLTTSHGLVNLRVPRCRIGGLDTKAVFERYKRRLKDVERILRHAYLLGCATRGLSRYRKAWLNPLAEQILGGCLSHQSISVLTRWIDALKAVAKTAH
jgi:transposase-like protein